MALEIRRDASIKVRVISTLVMAFALVVQPMYGFVANAVSIHSEVTINERVVINEISSATDPEWVELYGPANKDLSGWVVQFHKNSNGSNNAQKTTLSPGTKLNADGFAVVDANNLNNNGDVVQLYDVNNLALPVHVVSYGNEYSGGEGNSVAPTAMQSLAPQVDGGTVWVNGAPTKEISNGVAPVVLSPKITAENFNTHSAENYDGVSVGFNVKDFKDVTSVTVTLERMVGDPIVKTAGIGVRNLINDDGKETLTTPFFIKEGTLKEVDDSFYWNPASPTTWSEETRPKNVIVTIVNGDDTTHTADFNVEGKTFVEPNGFTYANILPPVPAIESTVVVRGDTSTAENQPGWMFNRDTRTATPFVFNTGNPSEGAGSLYVKPIQNTYDGANGNCKNAVDQSGCDKFVAENFLLSPLKDINSISYDYQIGNGGTETDDAEFYMNVYANFGSSEANKFYDCRYDVVPTLGSTSAYTKVTFDLNQAYPVVTRTGVNKSPHTCPAKPADMEKLDAGSTIRMFSLNVGGTSASDTGLDGYLDNVVVNTKSTITTYDFEPDTTAPATPTGLKRVTSTDVNVAYACGLNTIIQRQTLWPTWAQNIEDDFSHYEYTSYNGDTVGIRSQVMTTNQFQHNWVPTADGKSGFSVVAVDKTGNKSAPTPICYVTYDSTLPAADIASPLHGIVTKDGSLQVTGTATDNNFDFYKLYLMGGTPEKKFKTAVSNGVLDASLDIANVKDGTYKLRLHVKDKAGNSKDDYATITIDRTAPIGATISVHGVAQNENVYRGPITVTGSVDVSVTDVKSHWFEIKGPATTKYAGHNISANKCVLNDTKTQCTFTLDVSEGDGEYKIRYVVADQLGNRNDSQAASVKSIAIDNTAPNTSNVSLNGKSVSADDIRNANCSPVKKIHLVSGEINLSASIADSMNNVDGVSYKVRKVSDQGCTVSNVYSSGNVNMQNTENDTWTGLYNTDGATDSNGNKLTDGKYSIVLTAKDSLGNATTQFIDIEVDNTAPVVSIDPLTTTKDRMPTLTGNVYDAENVFVTIDGQVAKQATVNKDNNTWSYVVTESLEFGNHTVSVKAIDGVGNEGTTDANDEPATISFVVEQPTVDVTDPIDGDSNSGSDTTNNNQDSETDGQNVITDGSGFTPLVTTFTNPATLFFAQSNADVAQDDEDTAVLGTQTNNDNEDVKGASNTVAAVDTDTSANNGGTLFGLAWYWWLLIVAAIGSVLYAAARRRNQEA